MENSLPNGDFQAEVILSGGTGKTTVLSPAAIHIENGVITAEIIWSSPNYDYMEIDGTGYTPVGIDGGSVFSVALPALNTEIPIKAETVAMSAPHMIEYTLFVSGEGIVSEELSGAESTVSSVLTSSEADFTGSRVYFDLPVIAAAFGGAFVAAVIAAIIVQAVKRKKK